MCLKGCIFASSEYFINIQVVAPMFSAISVSIALFLFKVKVTVDVRFISYLVISYLLLTIHDCSTIVW